MKLHIVSDLHLEFDPGWALPATDADVLVLAGDIHPGLKSMSAFTKVGKPVLFVPGNHEFYGEQMKGLTAAMRLYAGACHVTLLDCDQTVIRGVRFLGATLWTDFALNGANEVEAALQEADRHMNDYVSIRYGEGWLTPLETVHAHRAARAWLEARLAEPFDGPTVVITHHAPHPGSIHPRYRGNALNPSFASDLDPLMGKARLWIHGHTHASSDYVVNGTRVICNPKGYRNENPDFQPRLVVEI